MGKGFVSINPYTGEEFFQKDFQTREVVKATIDQVEKAHKDRLSMEEGYDKARLKKDLTSLKGLLEERRQNLAEIISKEIGKPIGGALKEIDKAIKHTSWFIDNIEEVTKDYEVPTEGASKAGYHIDPLGLIFVVVPFNFPFSTPFRVIIPTLCAGNGVIIRMAGNCGMVGEAMNQLFIDAGLEQARVIFNGHDDTDYIMSLPAIQGMHFTGSTGVGRTLAQLCGKYLKRSVMELGGNDAFIVLKDADIDFAVDKAVASRLRNCGQVCTSAKRIIIHKELYDSFVEKLKAVVTAKKIGDPMDATTDIGPLCKQRACDEVWSQIQKTLESGDELLFGGEKPDGCFLKPTAVRIKDPSKSYVNNEEIFGPVLAIATFETEEEALELANGSNYGLGGTVITKDTDHGAKLSRKVQAGAVFVNRPVTSFSHLPAGGVKESGWGRDCGRQGVEAFANVKTFFIAK